MDAVSPYFMRSMQGSVATHLAYGEVFVYDFVTNFLLSLTAKEF